MPSNIGPARLRPIELLRPLLRSVWVTNDPLLARTSNKKANLPPPESVALAAIQISWPSKAIPVGSTFVASKLLLIVFRFIVFKTAPSVALTSVTLLPPLLHTQMFAPSKTIADGSLPTGTVMPL